MKTTIFLLLLAMPGWSRYPAKWVEGYAGGYEDAYNRQWDKVRLLARQAQLEVSSRIGLLQYNEGFQWPLQIRFADGVPGGTEYNLAYVGLSQTKDGFQQELVINVPAVDRAPSHFERVFYHEMTHAVMNDALGGEAAMKIPHWVQEGLAQYVSDEGNERVALISKRVRKSQANQLLRPLNGPYSPSAYPQYYLAIYCMEKEYSVNAVQAFVRNLIFGKTVSEAIQESTGVPWEKFEDQVRQCSLKVFQDKARPDLE